MCLVGETVSEMSFIQAGVMVLLALSLMLMNQQYTLQKVSSNRKTHGLTDENVTRGSNKLNTLFLLGATVQYLPIQCWQ